MVMNVAFEKMMTRIMNGKGLLPQERDEIIQAANDRFRNEYANYERRYNGAIKQAESYGLRADRTVPDLRDDDIKQQMDALNQRDKLSKSIGVEAINNATLEDINLLNKRVLNASQLAAVKKRLEVLGAPAPALQPTETTTPTMGPAMPPPMIKPLGGSLSTLGNKQLLPLGFGQ
jgi:hypothetical protein